MLTSWHSAMLLAFEATDVMVLRMRRISSGGEAAFDEAQLMFVEKIGAGLDAVAAIMCGGTLVSVIERYREHVAANACRLIASEPGYRHNPI